MAARKKYYKLKRLIPTDLEWDIRDIVGDKERETASRRCLTTHALCLIERTCMPDSTERVTNVWTMDEGLDIWKKYTKGRLMYDYTGVVKPLIHKGDKVYFFNDVYDKTPRGLKL